MKKIIKLFVSIIFLLGVSVFGPNAKENLKESVYGVWKIYKLIEVGGHLPEAEMSVRKSIGKKIEFVKDNVFCPSDLFFLKKGNYKPVKYELKIREYGIENGLLKNDGYDEGTLLFYGNDEAFYGKTIYLTVNVENGWEGDFEISVKHDLVTYYDGFLVFMKKIKN